MSNPSTRYVIVMHSGLGPDAVEHISVDAATARAVEAAGGIVCDTYGQGDAIATAALRYTDTGIAPIGVRGRFAALTVRGLPVFVPDDTIRTFAQLRRELSTPTSDAELLSTAEKIAAPAIAR